MVVVGKAPQSLERVAREEKGGEVIRQWVKNQAKEVVTAILETLTLE